MSRDEGPVAVGDRVVDAGAALVRPDGETERVALSALVAEGPVLLCFYTMDFSPDCTDEWCSFRDFDWFETGGVRVVGASKSGEGLHRRFIDRLGLGFPLYADTELALAESFGVDYRVFGLLRRARRSCFLVDEDLTVRYRWLAEHWLDPTRAVPPVAEIHDGVREALGDADPETFGF
jgi:peroxiredoxin Q/BCP